MNQDSSNHSDLLAVVDDAGLRLVRVHHGEVRSFVRVPIGGALTVTVAARIADALLDAQPTARVLILPRNNAAEAVANEFAEALDVRHPGDSTAILPDLETLLAVADTAAARSPDLAGGRRPLPRPSTVPRTIHLSPLSRV